MPLGDEIRFHEILQHSLWAWLGLAIAIVVLVWAALRLRQWFREDTDPVDDARQMLLEIREMYHEGDLSEQEYRSIRSRLTEGRDRAGSDQGD